MVNWKEYLCIFTFPVFSSVSPPVLDIRGCNANDLMHTKDNNFIRAMDSAVPCTMLPHMAQIMQDQLDKLKNSKGRSVSVHLFASLSP